MKRAALLCLVLLFAAQTALAEVTTSDAVRILQEKVENDVNHDGITDDKDALAIVEHIAGTYAAPFTAKLTCDKSDLVAGETLTLTAQTQGGFGRFTYRFEVVTEDGARVELTEDTAEASVTLTPQTGAEGTVTVTVTDENGQTAVADAGEIVIRGILTALQGQFTYYAQDEGVVILSWLDAEAESAYIPDTLSNLPVIEIGESAFEGKTKLKSVRLPDTVRVIGKAAFKNCTALTSMSAQG